MKRIVLVITLVLVAFNSFAQKEDNFKADIIKLMYNKKGMIGVENITKDMLIGIPTNSKRVFTTKANALKEDFIKSTIAQIKSDYTHEEITAIYNEVTSDKVNYKEETIAFFTHFRRLKGLYFRDMKMLYGEYK